MQVHNNPAVMQMSIPMQVHNNPAVMRMSIPMQVHNNPAVMRMSIPMQVRNNPAVMWISIPMQVRSHPAVMWMPCMYVTGQYILFQVLYFLFPGAVLPATYTRHALRLYRVLPLAVRQVVRVLEGSDEQVPGGHRVLYRLPHPALHLTGSRSVSYITMTS